ncbi:chemotaxis protein CheW [Rhizobium sp. L80/93]|nr:chemotaxis protein CheW [Rhizobium sp. E27B/91]
MSPTADADIASPITDISEILHYPKSFTALAGNTEGLRGSFAHRGTAVSLLCLATRLGPSQHARFSFRTVFRLLGSLWSHGSP